LRIISKYKPPGLIFEGAYYRGIFAFQIRGAYIRKEELIYGRRSLFSEFYGIAWRCPPSMRP